MVNVQFKCFKFHNLIRLVVVLFGLSLSLKMFPAAEPIDEPIRYKLVNIQKAEKPDGEYRFCFTGVSGIPTADSLSSYFEGTHEIVILPIQAMKITVKSARMGYSTFEKSYRADEIEQLQQLTIDRIGNITVDSQTKSPQKVTKVKPEASKDLTKKIWILGRNFISGKLVQIFFYDRTRDAVLTSASISEKNLAEERDVPIAKIEISTRSFAPERHISMQFTADEIAQLEGVIISEDGQITPQFAIPQQPQQSPVVAPVRLCAPKQPIDQTTVPLTVQYHELVKKGDIAGLLPLLPLLNEKEALDVLNEEGETALGNAVKLYKNALDIINLLVANGASLHQRGRAGKTPLDYADTQKDNLLRFIVAGGPCLVCFEDKKELVTLSCAHRICKECRQKLLSLPALDQRQCPTCRKPIE